MVFSRYALNVQLSSAFLNASSASSTSLFSTITTLKVVEPLQYGVSNAWDALIVTSPAVCFAVNVFPESVASELPDVIEYVIAALDVDEHILLRFILSPRAIVNCSGTVNTGSSEHCTASVQI